MAIFLFYLLINNVLQDSLQECDENIGRYQASISGIIDDIYKLFQSGTNSHVDVLCNVEQKCQAVINEEEKRDYSNNDLLVGETDRPLAGTTDSSVGKESPARLSSRTKLQNSITSEYLNIYEK